MPAVEELRVDGNAATVEGAGFLQLAKGKGVGLGRLRSREENDYDDDPVAPIDDIVQRLQPYAQPRGPVTPVPDAPQDEQQISDDVQDPSDRTA